MLQIHETYTNETKGYRLGESDWYEPYTDNIGYLFRDMQREYGRCMSSIYNEVPGDSPVKCGWYFEKRMQYEDTSRYGRAPKYYTRRVCSTATFLTPPTTNPRGTTRLASFLARCDTTPQRAGKYPV